MLQFDCLARAAKTGGVRQMWAGADLTIARSMLLSSSMLASYSEIKGILHRAQPSMFPADGIVTMFCGTLIASVIANTVVNPVDVIKVPLPAPPRFQRTRCRVHIPPTVRRRETRVLV